MEVAPEFLPANQDGSLELLLDCLDDFMIASHRAERRARATDQAIEIRYHNELPLRYDGDNFLTSLHATIRAQRYTDQRNVRGEYQATFLYLDETKTPLYGHSYFVKRFAGNHLDMAVQCTADEVGAYVEQLQPRVVIPHFWHSATEYDVQAFTDDFSRLQASVVRAPKPAT